MTGLIRSWVESANAPGSEFPLNNLPCGVFSPLEYPEDPRCGVAIGDFVMDVRGLDADGLLSLGLAHLFQEPEWNALMAAGPETWMLLREQLTELLSESSGHAEKLAGYLYRITDCTLHLPFEVSEYTDFYASKHHASNVGTMFRGAENALPPNWLHMPIGYNGRASSVVVSGTDVRRPWGQLKGAGDVAPRLAPCERFDIELELGAVVGVPSQGPLTVEEAERNIFGYVLLNDWSARDIQAWEYQPLGPFQGKATATSISPWIVMADALRPFQTPLPEREVALLPHLDDPSAKGLDISLEVTLRPKASDEPTTITRTNARELYYSASQQLAHHASSGCPMRVGDLLGSGTISGAEADSRGSLLELSWGGSAPFDLDCGAKRSFLEDGDTVVLTGWAEGNGYRVGFGECRGTVLPALAQFTAR